FATSSSSLIILLSLPFFLLMLCPPPLSTLFPYTTLFRSCLRPAAIVFTIVPLASSSLSAQTNAPPRPPGSRHRVAEDSQRTSTRSEEHTSELQSPYDLVCRLLLEKKKKKKIIQKPHIYST